MTADIFLNHPADSVSEIVDKTKVLVDRLRCAIIHQDNLTKDCFDTNATELSKTVDTIRKSYLKLSEEYQGVKEEIKAGEKRLNDLLKEYKQLLEENARLKEIENRFLNSKTVADEHGKIIKELRLTIQTVQAEIRKQKSEVNMQITSVFREVLQAYKVLTGVRFDFSECNSSLTGYVAISGTKPSNSTIIPFEISLENSTDKGTLWPVINQACLEIRE